MPTVDYRAHLRELPPAHWPGYLSENSGLPGPRGNLSLLDAVGDVADASTLDALIATDDEYLVACGVAGLGALTRADDPVALDRLRGFASDARWRVREAVAMALQRLGDADLSGLASVALEWSVDPSPLVRRAAVAGICEPRLLADPGMAATAIRACGIATGALVADGDDVDRESRRVLRQALGYCWSVAVAADPEPGLPAFDALRASSNPDVQWIVRENLRKKRLALLL